ncbi:hypothetical protein ACHAWF_001270, partial [Thalassiosira exigua]
MNSTAHPGRPRSIGPPSRRNPSEDVPSIAPPRQTTRARRNVAAHSPDMSRELDELGDGLIEELGRLALGGVDVQVLLDLARKVKEFARRLPRVEDGGSEQRSFAGASNALGDNGGVRANSFGGGGPSNGERKASGDRRGSAGRAAARDPPASEQLRISTDKARPLEPPTESPANLDREDKKNRSCNVSVGKSQPLEPPAKSPLNLDAEDKENTNSGNKQTSFVDPPAKGNSKLCDPPVEKEAESAEAQRESVERVLCASESGSDSHYKVLDLPLNATGPQITKSYRMLALKLHPNKNRHPNADQAFRAVNLAHDKLLDPDNRAEYDRTLTHTVQFSAGAKFSTLPPDTPVTIQGFTNESKMTHLNGLKGRVGSFNPQTKKYSVKMPSNWLVQHDAVAAPHECLFQNVAVKLRTQSSIDLLGSSSETLICYGKSDKTYQ